MKKEYTLTFTIRPFRWAKYVALVICLAFVGALPSKMSVSAADKPPAAPALLTQEEIERSVKTAIVESELASRIKGAHPGEIQEIAETLVSESARHGFDPLWVLAIIETESAFDVEACSHSGARGLMQILPSTFRTVSASTKMFDPVENVKAGIAYLAKLNQTFFRPDSILMAYNGGPRAANDFIKAQAAQMDTSYFSEEMRTYPHKVMAKYEKLLAKNGKNPKHARKLFKVG